MTFVPGLVVRFRVTNEVKTTHCHKITPCNNIELHVFYYKQCYGDVHHQRQAKTLLGCEHLLTGMIK